MEIVFVVVMFSSIFGVLITIRYFLGIESKRRLIKIGICRALIKIGVGLVSGFCMALILNATQQLGSIAVELIIMGLTLSLGAFASLKAYQIMLREWFCIEKSLSKLLKIGVLEFVASIVFLLTALVLITGLGL